MKNNMIKATITVFILFSIFIAPLNSVVNAQSDVSTQCVTGTGGTTGIECQVCYVNSYGICVPDTGFFSSGMKLDTGIVLISTVMFVTGLLLSMNGVSLKRKIDNKSKV
jgi:hypothetical protein